MSNLASFSNMGDPPTGIVAITPANTPLAKTIRGFMVTVTGSVAVVMVDGTVGIYPGCQPGAVYGGVITQISSSGTSATGIVGFY